MEEGKSEEHAFPRRDFGAVFELFGVEREVTAQQVILDAFRGFIGQLDAFLKNSDWEVLRRCSGQPHAELFGTGFGDAFEKGLELGHKGGG